MNRIKEARISAGIKQVDLCARLGKTQGAVSGWETGKYSPDDETWIKLSEILNVSVDYLMGADTAQNETINQELPISPANELGNRSISETEKQILESLPELTEEEKAAVNSLIKHYVEKRKASIPDEGTEAGQIGV